MGEWVAVVEIRGPVVTVQQQCLRPIPCLSKFFRKVSIATSVLTHSPNPDRAHHWPGMAGRAEKQLQEANLGLVEHSQWRRSVGLDVWPHGSGAG